MNGTYLAWSRAARSAWSKMRSVPAAKLASWRGSCANAFTTRTPTMFSSAWVVTSAKVACTSFSTGWLARE